MFVGSDKKTNKFTGWAAISALPFYGLFGSQKIFKVAAPDSYQAFRENLSNLLTEHGLAGEAITQFMRDNASTTFGAAFYIGLSTIIAQQMLEEHTSLGPQARSVVSKVIGTTVGVGGCMVKEVADVFINNPFLDVKNLATEFADKFDYGDAAGILVAAATILPVMLADHIFNSGKPAVRPKAAPAQMLPESIP